jgi:alanyl-tRNA synthetase
MNNKINSSYKIIADHLRSISFLIADGVTPSNEGRGYVLRRIMRRSMLHSHKINKSPFIYKLVPYLIKEMSEAYPELKKAQELIASTIKIEEEKFLKTLEKGIILLKEEIKSNKSQLFSGKIAFKLYDTYGFPLDLTENILKEQNIKINIEEFDKEMNEQKDRAKKSWSGSGESQDQSIFFNLKEKLGDTEFLGYENTKSNARIIAIISNDQEVESVNSDNKNISIILNKTPFYATSGGQRGDDGNLILEKEFPDSKKVEYNKLENIIDVQETIKAAQGLFIHNVSEVKGEFKIGDNIVALVNNRNRQFRAQNHSATHLLHHALKDILGNQVAQKGSNVESEYLTFDFNHNQAVTEDELIEIEDLVNFYIRQNSKVRTQIMTIEDANKKGALALFGEKYDDSVRVLSMGKDQENQDISIELCGGTHVDRTGNIGLFKIMSEKGIASGIRRIEAKTGYFALQFMKLQEKKLAALLESLKIKQQFDEIKISNSNFHSNKKGFNDISFIQDEESVNCITSQSEKDLINNATLNVHNLGSAKIKQIKEKDKEIENLKKEQLNNSNEFLKTKLNNINLISNLFENVNAKDLREITTQIRTKKENNNNTAILFSSYFNDKVSICLSLSDDLINNFNLNAGKIIPNIVEEIGGKGGGGRPEIAFGGGVNKSGIENANKFLVNYLKKL